MSIRNLSCLVFFLAFSLIGILGCRNDRSHELYGTWEGKTKIDQSISITIRPDSTIVIETEADSGRQVRKGTYQIVDRRIRIALTSLDTYSGTTVRREQKIDQDEALFTFTGKDEMVLRKGTQAIVLHRVVGR